MNNSYYIIISVVPKQRFLFKCFVIYDYYTVITEKAFRKSFRMYKYFYLFLKI